MTLTPSCWYAMAVGGSAKVNQELIDELEYGAFS
jgi:hypothetical protein